MTGTTSSRPGCPECTNYSPLAWAVQPPDSVTDVRSDEHLPGFNPPQQARSRAALQKVLTATEQVLATTGPADLTMAAVAERAGVSIGSIYGRFAGKDQLLTAVKDRLLTRIEDDLVAALAEAVGGLPGVVEAFTRTLADRFSAGSHVIPYMLTAGSKEAAERGVRALETMRQLFLDAAGRHIDEVRRPDPMTALVTAVHTITGACIYRTIALHAWPDGASWSQWATEISAMTVAYLTTSEDDHGASRNGG